MPLTIVAFLGEEKGKEEMNPLVQLGVFSYGRNSFRVSLIVILLTGNNLCVTYLTHPKKSLQLTKINKNTKISSLIITLLIGFLLSLLSLFLLFSLFPSFPFSSFPPSFFYSVFPFLSFLPR